MSYPSAIRVLVVEDESGAKDDYEDVFTSRRDWDIACVHYAFSAHDAVHKLEQNRPYHIVVLDLRIPEKDGTVPELNLGLAVLKRCRERDRYPIPALLVISGHLDETAQSDLKDEVDGGFFYGTVLQKGGDVEPELERAVERVRAYQGVGVHIRTSEGEWPILSPRDQDLIRRGVLQNPPADGVDLQWWSADAQTSSWTSERRKGWTKVFMGRFLLRAGGGVSRPIFAKLTPAEGARNEHESVRLTEKHLNHVKVCSTLISGDRALLVTEKVGEDNGRPIPLEQLLQEDGKASCDELTGIVRAIVRQLQALGDGTRNRSALKKVLWQYHVMDEVRNQLQRYSGDSSAADLLQQLLADDSELECEWRSVSHGDLNMTNVALDRTTEGYRAYVFDAAGCPQAPIERDLAMLEVTALLHQPLNRFPEVLDCLYSGSLAVGETMDELVASDTTISNTLSLVRALRGELTNEARVYALMVFDNAMMQLGGLAFPGPNKIADRDNAAALCVAAACWYQRLARESDGGDEAPERDVGEGHEERQG